MFVSQHVWVNKAQKVLLQKIVSFVPIAGPILSDVVNILWPAPDGPTPEEQFDVIKDHIRKLIDETLAEKGQDNPHVQAGRTTKEFAGEQANTKPAITCTSASFSITATSNHNSMAVTVSYDRGKPQCTVWHVPVQSGISTANGVTDVMFLDKDRVPIDTLGNGAPSIDTPSIDTPSIDMLGNGAVMVR